MEPTYMYQLPDPPIRTIRIRKRRTVKRLPVQATDGGRKKDGFLLERRDCTVRALAIAAAIPYKRAHQIMQESGRKAGQGASMDNGIAKAKRAGIATINSIPSRSNLTGRYFTLKQVVRDLPAGRWILTTATHAMAMIDGVIHDSFAQTGIARVDAIYEIILPAPQITQPQINELWERLNKLEAK